MTSRRINVTESSQVGEARRLAVAMAGDLGFTEIPAGKVAIVVREAASNLARYARQGERGLRTLEEEGVQGLEILAVDKGPGMADISMYLVDGYSSRDSAGIGLGAIARQSDYFELYSLPANGTVLMARFWTGQSVCESGLNILDIGAICLPLEGEAVCGDVWAVDCGLDRSRILVVDGLDHGPQAAEAAQQARFVFQNSAYLSPSVTIEKAHDVLHSSRGVVMAIAEVDHNAHVVRFCGVGNIYAMLYSEGKWSGLVSHDGIVGHTARKFQEFSHPYYVGSNQWPPLLVMHTDGLASHWNLSLYPDIMQHHSSLIAGVLYRDFKRLNYDVTILVTRLG